MVRKTTVYDIILSCPTDVEREQEVINGVINDFNRTIGNNLNIQLNLKHWTRDSYAQSGGSAQDLLNKQFINEADMIICIFWGRMGTPTESYESGTAEEMLKAIDKGKQVFLYFSNAPIAPRDMDGDQLARVKDFEKKIQDMQIAYYKTYDNLDEFKTIITTDLNLYFIQMQKSEKEKMTNQNTKKSDLIVSGVEHKKIINHVVYDNIYSRFDSIIDSKHSDIIKNFEKINSININSRATNEESRGIGQHGVKLNLFEATPYKYPEGYTETINHFANINSINLNEKFFEIGDLSVQKNYSYISGLGGSSHILTGSENAKEKQKLIVNLYLDICEHLDWIEYSEQFQDISLVRLALSNQGTIFESDITVTLKFSKDGYMPFKETNPPGKDIIERVNESNFIEKFFGDMNSVEINSYNYPIVPSMPHISNSIIPGYSYRPDYEESIHTYFEDQKDLQCYQEYEEDGYILQKYYFKELKQYISISFPAVLLFQSNVSSLEIEYEIISKENPYKKEGSIIVEE